MAARGTALDDRDDTIAELHAEAGKALAMALYNVGAVSLSATAAAFARHPRWRSA
jgi:hypothetical protein